MAMIPTPDDTPFVEALSELLRAIAGVVALLPPPEANQLQVARAAIANAAAGGQDALVDEPTTRDTGPKRDWQPNTLLTTAEFCQWVGITERTLRKWINDGTAPRRMRFGGCIRILVADALEWTESRYVD